MPDDLAAMLNERNVPFGKTLGVVITHAGPDRVEAEMLVRPEFCTAGETLHGGAVMSFADNVGAMATVVNLPEGARTTTIESKTNFVRPAPVNKKVRAVAVPIHKGRRTMVWTTTISTEEGKTVAVVTQSQMVLMPEA